MACPAGQSALAGGLCTACGPLPDSGFESGSVGSFNTIPGWTLLIQDGSQAVDITFLDRFNVASESPQQGGLALSVQSSWGAFAIVSAAHTVLPGEKLTIDLGQSYTGFVIANTMAYDPNNSGANLQARVDAYDKHPYLSQCRVVDPSNF